MKTLCCTRCRRPFVAEDKSKLSPCCSALGTAIEDVAGLASCGCVYRAEDGIPCEHDVQLAIEQGIIDLDFVNAVVGNGIRDAELQTISNELDLQDIGNPDAYGDWR